jgi:hypothetical protein
MYSQPRRAPSKSNSVASSDVIDISDDDKTNVVIDLSSDDDSFSDVESVDLPDPDTLLAFSQLSRTTSRASTATSFSSQASSQASSQFGRSSLLDALDAVDLSSSQSQRSDATAVSKKRKASHDTDDEGASTKKAKKAKDREEAAAIKVSLSLSTGMLKNVTKILIQEAKRLEREAKKKEKEREKEADKERKKEAKAQEKVRNLSYFHPILFFTLRTIDPKRTRKALQKRTSSSQQTGLRPKTHPRGHNPKHIILLAQLSLILPPPPTPPRKTRRTLLHAPILRLSHPKRRKMAKENQK